MGRVSIKSTKSIYYGTDRFNQIKILLYWLNNKPNAELVCTDKEYNYYTLLINGCSVMYARNKYRCDGVRMFVLNDALAKCLGFVNYEDMKVRTPYLQHSKKMLSVKALSKCLYLVDNASRNF